MKRLIPIVCCMVTLLAATGCTREVKVRIGVAAPMSGPLAQYGSDIVNGARIAVAELNEDRFYIDGKRAVFELAVEDDKGAPEDGVMAARKLADAKVAAVFGHFNSNVTIAAAPVYAQAGIPQISVSTNPKYTRMGLKTAFRITADDVQQGAALAALMRDKLRGRNLYLVDDRSTFGVGIADEVERGLQSGRIKTARIGVEANGTDFAIIAGQIMDAGVDTVFFGGYEAAGVPLLRALRAAGSPVRFVVADPMCDLAPVKAAQAEADRDYYCTVPGVPPSWLSAGVAFADRYKARFGNPGAYSALSYDGIHVLAQAMRNAGSADPASYLPRLTGTSFSGKIQGSIEFDQKGDIKDGTVVVYKVIDGALVEQKNLL